MAKQAFAQTVQALPQADFEGVSTVPLLELNGVYQPELVLHLL